MPKVSIVTPSFNQAQYLRRTIESVLSQDVDLEYIIIDGCSTDGSLEILKEYKNRAKVVIEKDDGQSDAISKGFTLASGEILAWLNSDDMYIPGALDKIVSAYKSGFEFVYGNVKIINSDDFILRKRRAIQVGFEDLYFGDYVIPQESTFFSRRLYDQCGGIDSSFQYAMDFDLWLKMSSTVKPKHIDDYISCFRFHEHQKSRRKDLYRQEVVLAKKKNAVSKKTSFGRCRRRKILLGLRKIYPNVKESGVLKTVMDVMNKKTGKLP